MKNVNGDTVEIDVVRYFINNDVEYLIYSLNEIDSAGYLNENNLKDITLVDTRVFKLQGNLVTLLSENKNVVEEEPIINDPIENIVEEIEESIEEPTFETVEEDPIDYEKLYNDLLVENDSLKQEVTELKEKLDKIKEILY